MMARVMILLGALTLWATVAFAQVDPLACIQQCTTVIVDDACVAAWQAQREADLQACVDNFPEGSEERAACIAEVLSRPLPGECFTVRVDRPCLIRCLFRR